jgi:SPP1 gp7 family putative phage head morphogenesis protein
MPRSITDIATRHQVLLERFKSGKVRDYQKVAKGFERDLIAGASQLGINSLDELTKKDLNSLISYSTELNKKYQKVIVSDLEKDLGRLAVDDANFEKDTIGSFVKGVAVNSAANIAYAKALTSPISATGDLLQPFVKDWSRTRVNQVNGVIRKGYKEGQTLSQMTQAIRGTRANNFKDGLTSLQTRQAQAVIRTAVQHVSATARLQTWEANSDIITAYKWRATLDGRTTQQCRSLDGLEFEMGKGPMPPIHINCRSTFVFVTDPKLGLDELDDEGTRSSLKGEVSAKTTYYDWLKTQPKGFQESAIGVQRTKWLNDGKLTAKEFAKLNLDKNFKPLTLDQMKAKRSSIISNKYGTTKPKPKPVATSATAVPSTTQATARASTPPATPVGSNVVDVIKNDTAEIVGSFDIDYNQQAVNVLKENVTRSAVALNQLNRKRKRARTRSVRDNYQLRYDAEYLTYEKARKARDKEVARIKALTQETDDKLKAVIFKKRHDEKLNTLKVIQGSPEKRARLAQAQELFENVLSADNLKSINDAQRLTTASFSRARNFRAHYKKSFRRIYLANDEDISTILHEMMHSLEYSRPEVSRRSKAFLKKRGAGQEPVSLRKLTGNSGYKANEIAVEDKFLERGGSHYMGKIYNRESSEILTMGVERLLNDPTSFYQQDKEYFNFMIEILNL